MNQENINMDIQPMDSQATVVANSPPSTPSEKASQVDKEKEMAELLMTMDNYKAIIPDAVIDYYLNKTGFDCDDVRIKKLFALAAQKFVADIATDAFQYNKVKQSSTRPTNKASKEKKIVLNMDDLSSALAEYGVNVKKPEFY
ncbi:hypothetical protein INT48_007458 [Thamnidium elegans]|uniref:Transcription initiation factor TFIID subunit 10 n=1 Tax=Thamnidium elegans TaxID=101142 RepID=A0A8H7SNU6_9FUNG|nr:hypothetical protein INT48_007458 [Thamnidium elegans]